MLTKAGKAALIREKGPFYLGMQRRTFAPTSWARTGGGAGAGADEGTGEGADEGPGISVVCQAVPESSTGDCTVSVKMATPSVLAIRVKATRSAQGPAA